VGADLKAIEQLAADQASLKAAAGLAKPGKWSGLGTSGDGALIWGECAGSGANPYRVMADLRDLGNKCTCPSRKFPCKHSLALLWISAEAVLPLAPAEIPEWVSDWLKRRRGGSGVTKAAEDSGPAKDVQAASQAEPEAPEDPKAAARREASSARRAEDTERTIREALDALDQWIGDQLRLGSAPSSMRRPRAAAGSRRGSWMAKRRRWPVGSMNCPRDYWRCLWATGRVELWSS
jgi:hypothetical protein